MLGLIGRFSARRRSVSAPFVTLTFGKVKEGKLADFRRVNNEIAALVERQEPRVVAFHAMLTDDGQRFAGMQFHPDADSMLLHLSVVSEAVKQMADVLEVEDFKVLGPSNEAIDGLLRAMAAAGVRTEHLPVHVGGFTRSSALE